MKQPKKLTREHKRWLTRCHLDPNNWLLLSEDPDTYTYVNKLTGEQRIRTKIKC